DRPVANGDQRRPAVQHVRGPHGGLDGRVRRFSNARLTLDLTILFRRMTLAWGVRRLAPRQPLSRRGYGLFLHKRPLWDVPSEREHHHDSHFMVAFSVASSSHDQAEGSAAAAVVPADAGTIGDAADADDAAVQSRRY